MYVRVGSNREGDGWREGFLAYPAPHLMGLLRRSTRVELLVCPGAGVQGVLPWYRPKKNGERLLIVCIPSDLYTPTASLSTVPHSGTRC